MEEKFNSLIKNNTWTLVSPSLDRKLRGCKCIFKIKRNVDGSMAQCKARLVVKDHSQLAGFDFIETFSPMVKP